MKLLQQNDWQTIDRMSDRRKQKRTQYKVLFLRNLYLRYVYRTTIFNAYLLLQSFQYNQRTVLKGWTQTCFNPAHSQKLGMFS